MNGTRLQLSTRPPSRGRLQAKARCRKIRPGTVSIEWYGNICNCGAAFVHPGHGSASASRERPGLDWAFAALREGVTLVVPKLDRLARSVPDARAIAEELERKGVKLALGVTIHDPADPMGRMIFNIVATIAEFEADLIRMRTREGMAIARARGKLRGKKPNLSETQQKELWRMHDTGEYSISDPPELYFVSRPTVYRTLRVRQEITASSEASGRASSV